MFDSLTKYFGLIQDFKFGLCSVVWVMRTTTMITTTTTTTKTKTTTTTTTTTTTATATATATTTTPTATTTTTSTFPPRWVETNAKPKDLKWQVGHSFVLTEVPHIDRDASPEAGDFGSRFSSLGGGEGVTRPL